MSTLGSLQGCLRDVHTHTHTHTRRQYSRPRMWRTAAGTTPAGWAARVSIQCFGALSRSGSADLPDHCYTRSSKRQRLKAAIIVLGSQPTPILRLSLPLHIAQYVVLSAAGPMRHMRGAGACAWQQAVLPDRLHTVPPAAQHLHTRRRSRAGPATCSATQPPPGEWWWLRRCRQPLLPPRAAANACRPIN